MPTPATDGRKASGGVGGAVKQVAEHASSIARLEVELATLEAKKKVATVGIGIGLGVGAALFGLFMIGFLFAAIAAAFATFLATWLALLIVTAILFALSATFGVLALTRLKRGTSPLPERAIREAKLTQAALKR
jgi:uncharacterized membrane protein YqjE